MSPWLTISEAAEHLRISESTLRKRVAENDVPHRHLGRRVVLNRDELDRWVDAKPGVRVPVDGPISLGYR
jgi:excisionase family DNA binding protein